MFGLILKLSNLVISVLDLFTYMGPTLYTYVRLPRLRVGTSNIGVRITCWKEQPEDGGGRGLMLELPPQVRSIRVKTKHYASICCIRKREPNASSPMLFGLPWWPSGVPWGEKALREQHLRRLRGHRSQQDMLYRFHRRAAISRRLDVQDAKSAKGRILF